MTANDLTDAEFMAHWNAQHHAADTDRKAAGVSDVRFLRLAHDQDHANREGMTVVHDHEPEPCEVCDLNGGYLLGHVDEADRIAKVEACDTCRAIDDDLHAAVAALGDMGGGRLEVEVSERGYLDGPVLIHYDGPPEHGLGVDARCRHCGDPIVYADFGAWVDVNGLQSCAPLAARHEPEREVIR